VTEVDAGGPVGELGGAMLEQSKRGDGRVLQRLRNAGWIVSEPAALAFARRTDYFLPRL
jgi:hypothetical protein